MDQGVPLNAAQKCAVEHSGSPALVIAGAGSGKTRVITHRIARLIEQGYLPRSIFAVTFTNKAAEEMAERLVGMVGESRAREVWISTFHALGAEIVRQEAVHVAGGDRWVIYDAADAVGVVKEILRELNVVDRRFDAAAILARISHAKCALTTPDRLPCHNEYDEIAALVFPRYVAALKRLRALDFDDLILVPLRLLETVEDVRTRWQERVRHLLVDEFQDTNRAQLLLIRALAGPRTEVFCVGDDDQAIYGWRGADVRNVKDFEKYFPGARLLPLEQNYRSCQPILDVANAVIEKAERVYPKRLFSDRKFGDKVTLVECDNQDSEVKFVVETTRQALARGLRYRDVAVLYRSNVLSRPLEEAFRLGGIPCRVIGGVSFYERREVKDLLAYLRLALHPEDDISFRRVVNYPARGIGDVSFERIERYALARGICLFEAARQARAISGLDERVQRALESFTGLIVATREKIEAKEQLADVARSVAAAIDLRGDLVRAGPTPAEANRRWGNIEALYNTLSRIPAEGGVQEARRALARLSLRFAEEQDDRENRVTLSTLHGAKGLEFALVFVVGCDEGILPHARTDAPRVTDIPTTIDLAEERRLLYVGITRARDRLYLVRAKTRAMRGTPRATLPSRFLLDIPADLIDRQSYSGQSVLSTAELAASIRAAREALAALKAGKG